jgi:acetyltransferase-like isoleucine patch superfamily enzyme
MARKSRNVLYSAWDLLLIKLDLMGSTLKSRFSLWLQGCPVGSGIKTSGKCYFKARQAGSIRIGNSVVLLAGQRSNRVGLTTPVLLETLGCGLIEIGDESGASSVVISSRSRVMIGKNVKIGGNVRVFDHDFHSLDHLDRRGTEDGILISTSPVEIGDDVFIGTNAIILKGCKIGARSVIGAGSVVSQNIPSNEVWAGNPARFIKRLQLHEFSVE